MTKSIIISVAMLMLAAAPASAMSCCGGKGKAGMCAKDGMKGGMAMSGGTMKKKGGCCCEGMAGAMSKRS